MTSVITNPTELNSLFGTAYKTPEHQRQNALDNYYKNVDKRKRQITLYNLNTGKCKKPNPTTIVKYDLKYDTVKNKWV